MNAAGKRPSTLPTVVLSLLVVGVVFWLQHQNRSLRAELNELRQALTQPVAVPAPAGPAAEVSIVGSSSADEIIALRGEVAALRRAWAERSVRSEAPVRTDEKAPLPAFVRRGWIDVTGLPQPVLETFRRQLGDAPFEGAHVKQSEGRFFYSAEAKLADGRHVELAMDSEGKVLHRSLEMPLESLVPPLQQAVLAALGDSTDPNRINEVFDDGRTVYRVTSKSPDQATIHVFTPEGQLLRSEVIRREDKP